MCGVVCLAFVALGIGLYSMAETRPLIPRLLLQAIAVPIIAFFGFFEVVTWLKFFDTRPGLMIDDEGFTICSGLVSMDRIQWEDVSGVSLYAGNQDLVIVTLKDPEVFLKQGNPLNRHTKRMNHWVFGSPIVLTAKALRITFDELRELVVSRFERFQLRS